MKKFNRLPIPNSKMGILLTISGIDNTAIIEYGPSGTTHFSIEFLMGTGLKRIPLFSSHIKENDILFGKTERLEKAIRELDNKKTFKYIFVIASSITTLVGIDIKECCERLQCETKAKLIPIEDSGNFGDISIGIENGLFLLVKELRINPITKKEKKFNIIGLTRNDCYYNDDKYFIENFMKKNFNIELNIALGIEEKIENLEKINNSIINIVTRPEGLKTAKYLEEKYKIPYVLVNFYGSNNLKKSLENISKILGIAVNEKKIEQELKKVEKYSLVLKRIFLRENINTIITGNYFETCGLCQVLENDLKIKVDKLVINHKILSFHKKYYSEYKDKIIYREEWNETEKYNIVLGDEEILDFINGDIKIRVSNPNIRSKFISGQNSFMGVEGILKLIEMIYNQYKI